MGHGVPHHRKTGGQPLPGVLKWDRGRICVPLFLFLWDRGRICVPLFLFLQRAAGTCFSCLFFLTYDTKKTPEVYGRIRDRPPFAPSSSRPCRYIRVPASLFFGRFPSIITARKRASKTRYLPPLRKLWPCGTQIRPLSHSMGHRYVPCPTVLDTKKGGLSRLLE